MFNDTKCWALDYQMFVFCLALLWTCFLECPGPFRESDSAGFPPGSSACGASHWKTHSVWGSVGLPWPRTHHCRFTQLQRPFLHTVGKALSRQRWKILLAALLIFDSLFIAKLLLKNWSLIHLSLSQGKEKMADMRRKALSRNSKSDHLTIVNAFQVKRPAYINFRSSPSSIWMDHVSSIDLLGLGGSETAWF